ncbi:MAG TPA: hypothetical protein VM619_05005 [Luteimonas sp.]|nr:hypothetical protein [Luteimonas sp.]
MRRLLLPFAFALACAACGQAPPSDSAERATVSAPAAADAPAPANARPAAIAAGETASAPAQTPPRAGFAPLPPGAPTTYTCDDESEVKVAYGKDQATVTLADGRGVVLPKAQSASKGGGDVYVGEAVSLMRDGTRLELHVDESPARTCHAHQT